MQCEGVTRFDGSMGDHVTLHENGQRAKILRVAEVKTFL